MSAINPQSEGFKANVQAMLENLERVRTVEGNLRNAELKYTKKARRKKKLLPRDRLNLLLDADKPFLELMSLSGYGMYGDTDGSTAGGSMIAGIGYVSGVRCIAYAMNYAIKGGTMNAVSVKKTMRLQEIALEQKLPIVCLNESGGGDLSPGVEDPWMGTTFIEAGRSFYNQARLTAAGIPQVAVVHGNATAGGAYQPGLSDYIVLIKKQSNIFLAGPPLLKAATGEIATAEDLGGADMHSTISGTGEYLASNDAEGIGMARQIMDHIRLPHSVGPPPCPPEEPRFSPQELMGIVPVNKKEPYDCKEIIKRIADGSKLLEFKAQYDYQTICCYIRLGGWTCGVIGNNGPITPRGSAKAAQFMQLCDQNNFPLIFLQNTTGFMVGVEVEQGGAIKHGSKMIQAVSNYQGPKVTIVVGSSYGAGNYAMCSRSMKPDFIFGWPCSKTAVMGGEQAGQVLKIIGEAKMKRMGQEPNMEFLNSLMQQAVEEFNAIADCLYTSARLFDDGLIDPRDTRQVLLLVLDICRQGRATTVRPNTFGVARL